MPEFTLRPVTAGDEPLLLEIFTASHPEYQYLPLPENQKQYLIAMQFRMQSADYRSRYPDSTHDIIESDGEAVGRIWVARTPEHISVLDIGLLPTNRAKGLGTVVIDQVKAEAIASQRPILSVVQKANAGSLRWQLRMGFHVTSEDEFSHYMEWRPPAITQSTDEGLS